MRRIVGLVILTAMIVEDTSSCFFIDTTVNITPTVDICETLDASTADVVSCSDEETPCEIGVCVCGICLDIS